MPINYQEALHTIGLVCLVLILSNMPQIHNLFSVQWFLKGVLDWCGFCFCFVHLIADGPNADGLLGALDLSYLFAYAIGMFFS